MAFTGFRWSGERVGVYGPSVAAGVVCDVGETCIDSNGDLLVQDKRSAAISYFARDGVLQRSSQISRDDMPLVPRLVSYMGMTADDRGNVYVFDTCSNSYLRLSPDARVSKVKQHNGSRIDYDPRTGDHCQWTTEGTKRFFRDGRAPVGLGGECAPDMTRSLALPLDDGKSVTVENNHLKHVWKVAFYSETGSLKSTTEIPNDGFYDVATAGKRWLVVSGLPRACCLFDLANRGLRELELQPAPAHGGRYRYLLRVEPDGSETLLQVGLESRIVRAFPLPMK
jgi:hypothetical protein